MSDDRRVEGKAWPPPPPDSLRSRRRRPPPERHARWIDHEHRGDEPREEAPRLLWWILGALLIFGVFSVLIRMFLVL